MKKKEEVPSGGILPGALAKFVPEVVSELDALKAKIDLLERRMDVMDALHLDAHARLAEVRNNPQPIPVEVQRKISGA